MIHFDIISSYNNTKTTLASYRIFLLLILTFIEVTVKIAKMRNGQRRVVTFWKYSKNIIEVIAVERFLLLDIGSDVSFCFILK